MKYKIRILKNCLVCGQSITQKRYRTYCSAKCRQKEANKRTYKCRLEGARERRGKYSPDKVMCLICGRYYVQVGSHVAQRHHMSAREYREEYELPVKKGIVPLWYKKLKGDIALENKTYKNLEAGKKCWFVKGDPRAIINTFYKGQYAEARKLPQEIYPHK